MITSPNPSLLAYVVALFQILGFGGLAVAIVRTRPALKKIAADREANLLSERAAEMEAMRARIERLEEGREKDREGFETKLETERVKHERQIARYRHKVRNLQQSFDALLLLLKRIPEAGDIVVEIKEMRARQAEAEALESQEAHDADLAAVERGRGEK